ncbi:MAG: hypothetical protein ACRDTN_02495 [Mycobacterium sp.]
MSVFDTYVKTCRVDLSPRKRGGGGVQPESSEFMALLRLGLQRTGVSSRLLCEIHRRWRAETPAHNAIRRIKIGSSHALARSSNTMI